MTLPGFFKHVMADLGVIPQPKVEVSSEVSRGVPQKRVRWMWNISMGKSEWNKWYNLHIWLPDQSSTPPVTCVPTMNRNFMTAATCHVLPPCIPQIAEFSCIHAFKPSPNLSKSWNCWPPYQCPHFSRRQLRQLSLAHLEPSSFSKSSSRLGFGCLGGNPRHRKSCDTEIWEIRHMGGSQNEGTQQWMVDHGTSYWNGWFGATPISGNLHLWEAYQPTRKIRWK